MTQKGEEIQTGNAELFVKRRTWKLVHPDQAGSLKVVGGREMVSKAKTDPERRRAKGSRNAVTEGRENNWVVV